MNEWLIFFAGAFFGTLVAFASLTVMILLANAKDSDKTDSEGGADHENEN